jgi:cytochrome P450
MHLTTFGSFLASRHAEVSLVMRDKRFGKDFVERTKRRYGDKIMEEPVFRSMSHWMLQADPPDHTRLRRLASKAFTPRAVESLRPRVAALVAELLDDADERGSFDMLVDLAEPLPVVVICELLGVPPADHEQFKGWSTAVARTLDAVTDPSLFERAVPALVGFVQYFSELIEQRRADPRDDLLSALIRAEADGATLTTPELFAMVILLFIAGHETTTNLLGNGTLALARRPDEFTRLRRQPDLLPGAVEELLRYDSPVQVTARTATCDLDVNGIAVRKGEGVVCALAGANRDPAFVDAPDALRVARPPTQHLAFGHGMHHCLGAPLARLEGQEVFGALARRYGQIDLLDDRPPYREHFVLRGLASLPLALTRG